MNSAQPSREHLVSHQGFNIYVRHYAGTGPTFVLMHGFPDNLHIYDRLIPALRGHQVITFDFLGWGASDKPVDHAYTSQQQEVELHAVLTALQIEQVVPVAHDASGPVAINWALDHPERVSALVLLNTYYGYTPTLRFPEWVSLFADPAYAALARAITKDLTVAEWLFRWQGRQFTHGSAGVPEGFLQMIWPQFAATPGTFPAVLGLTSNLHATLQTNTQRMPDLKRFERPVRIIFGAEDPYLNTGVAQSLHEALPTSNLLLLPEKGHWPQLDGASAVAQALLSLPETSLPEGEQNMTTAHIVTGESKQRRKMNNE